MTSKPKSPAGETGQGKLGTRTHQNITLQPSQRQAVSDFFCQMEAKLVDAGLIAPIGGFQADGQLHRCATNDKPKSRDGAYIVHTDAPASVWWMNWHAGESGTWCAKSDSELSHAERKALRERIEADKAAVEAERAKLQAEAAKRAREIWDAAPPATADHPYLVKKQVFSFGLRLAKDGRLVVPLLDESSKLQSIQFIAADGVKRFLSGGRKKGCCYPIPAKEGQEDKPLHIAEGYATAATIHEATGCAVLVAFDAGNLLEVAKKARERYAGREIVLCADYDASSEKFKESGGIGVAKATEAARAINGMVAVPRREGHTKLDFNDLASLMGTGEVLHQILARREPDPLPEQSQEDSKDKLPSGFSIRNGGLWHTEVKEDADPVETYLGPELTIEGLTRDANSKTWGLLLSWSDPDGIRHTWAMPREMLVARDNSAWLGRLASEGYAAAPSSKAKSLLALFLSSYRTTKRVRCVPRTGWHDGTFVLPDCVFYATASDKPNVERVVLQVQTPRNPFQVGGTFDGWRDTVGIWSQGNSRLMLSVCSAFAAPLLELCGLESGGLNFVGASSCGKTTSLVAAASVWGRGASSGGFVQNWRATSNGLEGLAALYSDTLLCLDEIGQASGRTISEAAYLLANGVGKSRAYSDGSVRAIRAWRVLIVSTGEVGLATKILEEGGHVKAGQSVRLVDVPADAGVGLGLFEDLHGYASPQVFADVLKNAAAANYGHAARAFISRLQEQRDEARAGILAFIDRWLSDFCPPAADGQVQRVARRFLLCAAAGELATGWGLLPWSEKEAVKAVRVCFDAWLASRGGTEAAEDVALVAQVKLFLEQHGQSRFQSVDTPDALCVNRVGFRQEVDGRTVYYVLPESFKTEVCHGYDHKRAAVVLLEKGILIAGDSRNVKRRPSISLPGYGRKRCYVLTEGEGGDHAA